MQVGAVSCWNSDDLKRVQKSAMRIIYGKPYESYSDALRELGIMRLSERRKIICLKFAKNSLKIHNFRKLFPEFKSNHLMKKRNVDKYTVSRCLGKRYAVSAVSSMQRLLNNDHRKQKQALKSLMSPTNYASNGFYC